MKRPIYNLMERQLIKHKTLTGAFMELDIAWTKMLRDIEKHHKNNLIVKFIKYTLC